MSTLTTLIQHNFGRPSCGDQRRKCNELILNILFNTNFRTFGHIGKFSEVDFLEFELIVLSMAMKRNPHFGSRALEEALTKVDSLLHLTLFLGLASHKATVLKHGCTLEPLGGLLQHKMMSPSQEIMIQQGGSGLKNLHHLPAARCCC